MDGKFEYISYGVITVLIILFVSLFIKYNMECDNVDTAVEAQMVATQQGEQINLPVALFTRSIILGFMAADDPRISLIIPGEKDTISIPVGEKFVNSLRELNPQTTCSGKVMLRKEIRLHKGVEIEKHYYAEALVIN